MKQMVIGFVTRGLPFNGNTLNERGLGGSETALLCMARELAARGHRVAVFCVCDAPGTYDGVDYYSIETFPKICEFIQWDVLVASRWMEDLTIPSQAGLRVLWLHDTLVAKDRLWNAAWQTDEMMLLSDFHIANYTEAETEEERIKSKVAEFRAHMWKTSNGVDLDLIDRCRRPKIPGKIIFTSRPERGLHFLLQHVLPELIKEFPHVKLHYANYSLGAMQVPPVVAQINQLCETLAKQMPDNVVNMGHLTKDELYQEISSAELMLYPTEFPEISCITAMEAAACGTPIITTKDFALVETVSNTETGYLIEGKPSDGETYFARFNRRALRLLRNNEMRKRMSEAGRKWILEKGFTWAQVAESWERHWIEKMEARLLSRTGAVIDELVRNSDLVMARDLAESLDYPEFSIGSHIEAVTLREAQPPQTGEDVLKTFRAALPRFNKLALFMRQAKMDPQRMWDFAAGDGSFGIYMVKASPKVTAVVIDRDQQTVDRLGVYATQNGFGERVLAQTCDSIEDVQVGDQAPDLIFFGDYLDTVEAPWEVLTQALKAAKPGGRILLTTRFGPQTATLPKSHNRMWNFDQQDYYEMFGVGFAGEMTRVQEGISPGGDPYGHWLCWIPVPETPVTVGPLGPRRRGLITRPYESLTVSMIGKDEERWAAMCLEQIVPIADKIRVVLDSRTTDHTRDVLNWFEDDVDIEVVVADFEDFARQRNLSIKDNDTDWTLWIDFDERLTEPTRLRKYLRSVMFEGFALRQCHLMLDLHGTFDVPVRLLRNREHYRFVGCIHEHCEDTSQGYDSPIHPSFLLEDTELAHYGYLNEKSRRLKCSNRNMELLHKDVTENGKKGRKLTWVLVMRDYINIVKWRVDKLGAQAIRRGSEEHKRLEAAVTTFLEHFPDSSARYYQLAWPMYQEALRILGLCGIPTQGRTHPPFSVALGLAGSVGVDARSDVKAKTAWFLDEVDYLEFQERQSKTMLDMLGIVEKGHYAEDLAKKSEVSYVYSEDAPDLLRMGVGAIDETTGKMK